MGFGELVGGGEYSVFSAEGGGCRRDGRESGGSANGDDECRYVRFMAICVLECLAWQRVPPKNRLAGVMVRQRVSIVFVVHPHEGWCADLSIALGSYVDIIQPNLVHACNRFADDVSAHNRHRLADDLKAHDRKCLCHDSSRLERTLVFTRTLAASGALAQR